MQARGAVEMLEESVNLLREAPPEAIAAYLTGAIPFSLGLLFFFTEMIRSPFASERLALESAGVAVLLLWKHVWQAIFMARLHGQLSPRAAGGAGIIRLAAMQCAIQPLRLVVVPLSLLLTVPFVSVVAFFRNLALFAALGEPDPIAAARRQASLWTKQNWGVLSVTAIAALFLFANVLILLVGLPSLARSFLGIEGDLARLGIGFLNLTTAAVAASLTWLVIDAILGAVYVLRCFYGASVATGEDLTAALRRAIGVAALMLVLIGAAPGIGQAQTTPTGTRIQTGTQIQTIDPARLDRSIDQTIHRREFTWRSPPNQEPQGRWTSWVRSAVTAIVAGVKWLVDRIFDWFRPADETQDGKGASSPRRLVEIWTAMVVALLITGVIVFFFRRRGAAIAAVAAPTAAAPAANLADESLTADRLPESSWLKLAEESLARGEYRLALRALYLASLNHMSQREFISIRLWKTGLDYRRELERRVRSIPSVSPELAPVFARIVAMFERGWYGRHAVDRAAVDALMGGLQEMRQHAQRA
jgi:hypothetical protein